MILGEKEAHLVVVKRCLFHDPVYVLSELRLPIILTNLYLHHLTLTHHSS
jgi:hypothetical protein